MTEAKKLTPRQRIVAIGRVAKLTFKAAPGAVFVQVLGAFIDAILPIVTTYYAALTTTALAEAFAGDQTAGARAITYVIVTAFLGIIMTAWSSLQQYINQLMRYKI